MKSLSTIDSAFLFMERPEMPMHVGSVHLLSVPKGQARGFAERLRKHLRERLELAPALTRIVQFLPLNVLTPYWQHADKVDMKQQVLHERLPAPGDLAGLHERVASLHAELLDRSLPLWQMVVFTGLGKSLQTVAGHEVIALYSKVHHAAVDGQGAVALANAILDLSPDAKRDSAPKTKRSSVKLGLAEALTGALSHQLAQAVDLAKRVPDAWQLLRSQSTSSRADRKSPKAESKAGTMPSLSLAPRTPFNASITAERCFGSLDLPLPALKLFSKLHGASINDAVLAIVTGAMRRYLKRAKALPKKSLVAAIPVSLRASGDASANNQVAMTLMELPTHVAQADKRFAAILTNSARMKSGASGMKGVLPTDFPAIGWPWLVKSLTQLYSKQKLADRLPPIANLVVSNVPGPQVPLYLAGAAMLSYVPVSIVTHGLGLNVTVQSYNGRIHVGLLASPEAVSDMGGLVADFEAAWLELQGLMPHSL